MGRSRLGRGAGPRRDPHPARRPGAEELARPLIQSLLADVVLVLHLAFVAFVIAGGLLVARFKRLLIPHLMAAAWGVFIAASGGICPLTPLENGLRRRAGQAGYDSGFLEHYLVPVLYPEGLTRGMQWALAGFVVVVNAVVYASLLRRRVR